MLIAATFAAALVAARSAPAAREQAFATGPLETALFDDSAFEGANADLELHRARAAGASAVRLSVPWDAVAPATRPARFKAADPADHAYRWGAIDRAVKLAVAQGLEPILDITSMPKWARVDPGVTAPGPWSSVTLRPDVAKLVAFSKAAATRYDGHFRGLPRVRYWEIWNEPNLNNFLSPQYVRGRPVAGQIYRQMVNTFADAVHGVDADNVVVAGGLAPDLHIDPKNGAYTEAPLVFMRSLLCMSDGPRPRPTCSAKVNFDVWSMHPYTNSGPAAHAHLAGDVWLGDLPTVTRLLRAALAAGHIQTTRPLRFWVTEFAWTSRPPVANAVPVGLEARWVSEALYQMWRSGVSLVTWFKLRDDPPAVSVYQTGLYFNNNNTANFSSDTPKPALASFFFPFVAYAGHNGIFVWGRTPWGRPQRVLVERSTRTGWRTLGLLKTSSYGIFSATFADRAKRGVVRARVVGPDAVADQEKSRPFSLVRPPRVVVPAFPR